VTIRSGSPSVFLQFEARAVRAESLAPNSPSARAPLLFASGLYRAQGRMAAELEAAEGLSGSLERDATHVLPAALPVASFLAGSAPDPLREEARARCDEDADTLLARLLVFWREGEGHYLYRAMLRPYVEVLSRRQLAPNRSHREGRCPFCGGSPWISVRRGEPESDAARRFLACSLCGGEWSFYRVRCPCCAEENPENLPSFRSDAYPAAQIDACETCRRYLKSMDLTEDARPIPEVDDLVSLSLDLWASEEGFTRIEPGLAGL
jgi:FdhE protein